MEKVTGVVRFRMKNERYAIAYEIENGMINLDKSGNFPDEAYGRAFHKVSKEHQDTIEKMVQDSNLNMFEDVPETEEVTKIESNENIEVTDKEKVTKIENEPKMKIVLNQKMEHFAKDTEKEELLKQLKELKEENERLRANRGGRPSIGETRKASLTLPEWLWKDIDRTVLVTGVKQSAFLRDLILEGYHHHTLALNKKRGLE